CQEGSKSYIDDIAAATKHHLDKACDTLASCVKKAVIAYQNMRPSTMMRSLQPRGLVETLCGSPLYMAPKITQLHKYDAKVDLWSVGAISFQLLTSENTFRWNNQIKVCKSCITVGCLIVGNVSILHCSTIHAAASTYHEINLIAAAPHGA
nr:serine/threonine-protein kinase ATG1c [Tanacetum cinerariifolium]